MNTKVILIVGAVIVALYFVFSRNQTPSGLTTQLGLPGIQGNSQAGVIASSVGSLGSSIARALGGSAGSPLPSGTAVPAAGLNAPLNPAQVAGLGGSTGNPMSDVQNYYSLGTANESIEEPTFANNSNSFTIVGTGPAPIAAPQVTPSVTPTPGVLAFLNPNGNIPPPVLADGGSGNYSLDNSSLLASGPTTSYSGGSVDNSGSAAYWTSPFGDTPFAGA
jgi:hypothetical protein